MALLSLFSSGWVHMHILFSIVYRQTMEAVHPPNFMIWVWDLGLHIVCIFPCMRLIQKKGYTFFVFFIFFL